MNDCVCHCMMLVFVLTLYLGISEADACDCDFWENANGATALFVWANGTACESLPSIGPDLSLEDLQFIPVQQTVTTDVPSSPAIVSSARCYEICPSSGSVCGSRTTFFGLVTIPPEGGLFQASVAITVTQLGPPFYTVSNSGAITIDEPGEFAFAISKAASVENVDCNEHCMLVQTISSMSLSVNGNEGSVSVLQEGQSPLVNCQSGDGNGDGNVDGADIVEFIELLINNDETRGAFCRVDMNNDAAVDALDLPAFVAALLGE